MKPKVDPRTGKALGGKKPALPSHIIIDDQEKISETVLSDSDLLIFEDLNMPLASPWKEDDESNKAK